MTAIKWNGLAVLGVVVVAMVGAAALEPGRRWRKALGGAVLAIAAAGCVYVASYATWFVAYEDTQTYADRCEAGECGTEAGDRVTAWFWEQGDRARFHRELEATHPDRSSPSSWLVIGRPVLVYAAECVDPLPPGAECSYGLDESRQILTIPNPVLWWPAFLAVVPVLVLGVRRRGFGTVVAASTVLALYLPWFGSPKPGFLYFLTPAVPFLALVLARAVDALPASARVPVAASLAVGFVAVGAFLAPLHYGWPIDRAALDLRSWLPTWSP